MNPRRIGALVALGLMLLAFAAAQAWKPTKHLSDMQPKVNLEAMFPQAFGEWTVDDGGPVQLISPDQAAVINRIYNQTLSRTYVNRQGDRIMLSVAYGGDQSDGFQAHRPEVCYPAQGFQILSSGQSIITTAHHALRVRQLVAKLGGRNEPITYWLVVGERTAVDSITQKLAQLSYGVRGLIPDGMLVRVSSIDANPSKAYGLQQSFIASLSEALPSDVWPQIVGRTGS